MSYPRQAASPYFPFAEREAAGGHIRPRIVCLPWAGGTAAAYRPWMRELGTAVEVLPAEMPGHGGRRGEACIDDAPRLAAEIAAAVLALPGGDVPVLLFGHSMGAMLAFEAARRLQGRPVRLIGLVLAGHHAPHWPRERRRRSAMSDAVLREDLRQMGGTAPEILDSPELMSLILPALRSDYRLTERYKPALDTLLPKLTLPVDILGGAADEDNPPDSMEAWREVVAGPVEVALWPGGHFFIEEQRPALLAHLRRRAAEWARASGSAQPGAASSTTAIR
jgi:surfactin synthase thioesterase subunit